MSKKMKSAYFALRLKDKLESVVGSWYLISVWVAALVLGYILDASAAGSILSCVTAFFACIYGVSVLCIKWCTTRMRKMGYDEVELERLALA